MTIRPARLTDFDHLETFVWQAIFPAFDVDGLTSAQRAENDALVENARTAAVDALQHDHFGVFVAIDSKLRTLAGYIIADARPRAYAEIRQLIVKRSFHGKGVGELLLDEATEFIGQDRAVSLSVRHFNGRAIAFFAKHGFENTGETTGNHAISRSLMLREAFAAPVQDVPATTEDDSFGYDFPSAADEPVFEELPDYNLATDESPLFETGVNALRTEEVPTEEPEETHLTEDQLSVLEAFIAKARAKKASGGDSGGKPPSKKPQSPKAPTSPGSRFDRSKIAFEIDYGEGQSEHIPSGGDKEDKPQVVQVDAKPSFSFDFSPVEENQTPTQEHVVAPERATAQSSGVAPADFETSPSPPEALGKAMVGRSASLKNKAVSVPKGAVKAPRPGRAITTKDCPDCATKLPAAARFCFVCGMPQAVNPAPEENNPSATNVPKPETPEDELQLTELPPLPEEDLTNIFDNPASESGASIGTKPGLKTAGEAVVESPDEALPEEPVDSKTSNTDHAKADSQPVSILDLRKAFQRHLQDRVLAYFGERKLKRYLERMNSDSAFLQVRDGSLNSLAQWLSAGPAADVARGRRQNTFADLTEYFIVETAGDLSNHVLPQRLLRHQSADWQTADLFKLVMDYLNFESEADVVHTDFVTMPARALKNATKSFLQAAKDERVFFICDQSLISQAKNGFAVTDSGIYWKNVLQPAGAATFTTMREPRLESGHLIIDGQFFDAGGRLNLKVAVLLDKLRRMR